MLIRLLVFGFIHIFTAHVWVFHVNFLKIHAIIDSCSALLMDLAISYYCHNLQGSVIINTWGLDW
jgi:hypothetical protein